MKGSMLSWVVVSRGGGQWAGPGRSSSDSPQCDFPAPEAGGQQEREDDCPQSLWRREE